MTTTTETIEAIIISQCTDCGMEINRRSKFYTKTDFDLLCQTYPNKFYTEAGTNNHFVMVGSICQDCSI